MFVRSVYALPDYLLGLPDQGATFRPDKDIQVHFINRKKDDSEERQLVCVVWREVDRTRVEEGLAAWRSGRLPKGTDMRHDEITRAKQAHGGDILDVDGKLKSGVELGYDILPGYLKEFERETRRLHRSAAERCARLIRWITGRPGGHLAVLGLGRHMWSSDGEDWQPMPNGIAPWGETEFVYEIDEQLERTFQALLEAGTQEPLAHELLREAWEQSEVNRRSSLIIGYTALEVGLKQHIGLMVPQVAELMESLPSPPVTRLLEFVPSLVPDRWLTPPKSTIASVKALMSARNELAHRGKLVPEYYSLREKLIAVRDLLYALDYQRGLDWASYWIQYQHGGAKPIGSLTPIFRISIPKVDW